jgi:ComF family protein
MLGRLLDPLLTILYPQLCHVCHGSVDSHADGVACAECWATTRIFDGSESLCKKCGAPSKDGQLNLTNQCGQCSDGVYDAAVACGVYEKALAATIVNLKKRPHLSARVQDMLGDLVEKLSPIPKSVVVPVPLSKRRRFERGHNQADVIAQAITDRMRLQIIPNALHRTDSAPIHRIGMDKKARETTVKNSFVVRTPRLIDGKDILLVDDVLTSGSTASYCAKVLKKNGAASVRVLTLARAVMCK